MWQDVIAYLIVFYAFGYAVYKFFNFFTDINKNDICSKCNKDSCLGCPFYKGKPLNLYSKAKEK